ncbi:hypothetical protein SDC9_138671 [bioreactor metagenome]|uniref:Uncharacterized protein n=1 Tax=bioreactor metagenome TaxID=1076179 RepID=A0A645DPY9_9ZZZZ
MESYIQSAASIPDNFLLGESDVGKHYGRMGSSLEGEFSIIVCDSPFGGSLLDNVYPDQRIVVHIRHNARKRRILCMCCKNRAQEPYK